MFVKFLPFWLLFILNPQFVALAQSTSIFDEDFKAITKHEDELIDKFYPLIGIGLDTYNPKKEIKLRSKLIGIKKTFKVSNKSVAKAKKLYNQIILPIVKREFPKLFTNKDFKYKYFLKKARVESYRNILFADLTAAMHKSSVPDLANIFFAASHPYYDAIFDIDFKNSPYNRYQLVERVSKIIQRQYNLPEPILPIEKIVIEITEGLWQNLPKQNRKLFFKELYKLNVAQIDSLKQQFVKNISIDDLRRTTFKKGGLSMVLYALLADHHFDREEIDIYFLEGAFLQNLDDMNDILEDQREGGVTLAGSYLITPYELTQMTKVWFDMLDKRAENGSYSKQHVENYKYAIDIFINTSKNNFKKSWSLRSRKRMGPIRGSFYDLMHFSRKAIKHSFKFANMGTIAILKFFFPVLEIN